MNATSAVILAAGRGSRLGEITRDQPKCLTPLAGRPLLEWQLAALRAAGVERIAIVTGYLAERLQPFGSTLFHNARWADTNMVASLVCAAEWLEAGTTVVSYSDIVYGPAVVRKLMAARDDVAISYDRSWLSLWQLRFDDPLRDAETFRADQEGRLLAIGERPQTLDQVQGQFMGLIRFTPAGWQRACSAWQAGQPAQRDRLDMTGLLRRMLERGERIGAVPVDGGWCEVDSIEDLRHYETALAASRPWSHDWREPGERHVT
jgi:L-glutamine-phosphate cytidylyltransferase